MKIDKKAIAGIKRYVRDIIKENHDKLYDKEHLDDFWGMYAYKEDTPDEIVYDVNIYGGEYGDKKDHVRAVVYHTTFDGEYYGTDTSDEFVIGDFYCQETYFGWGLFVKGGHGLVLESWDINKNEILYMQNEWKAEFPSIETFVIETEKGATQ